MGTGEMKAGSQWFWVCIITAVCAAVVPAGAHRLQELSPEQKFSIASCNFTLNLLKLIENEQDSNIAFSPSSIAILLAVLQQGAGGNTLEELNNVLHLRAEEAREGFRKLAMFKEEKKVELKWGNQCFLRSGTELESDFQKTVGDNFRLRVVNMDFATLPQDVIVTEINDWIRHATQNRINDLVDPSMVSPDTDMLLINEIFFKGNWLRPFKLRKSKKKVFHINEKDSAEAVFMKQKEKFYSDRNPFLGAKWLQMPFEDQRFSMVFILPTRKNQLSRLIRRLSGGDLHAIFSSRSVSDVKVQIPKFKLSQKFSLAQTLQELGVRTIFSGESDLRGMVHESLQVSDMIHQVNIEIDENGSTSTAATVVHFLRMQPPSFTFIADHPFLFFLLDVQNNVPLFAGKVTNPAA